MSKQTAVEWLIDMLVTENEITLKGENYKLFEIAKAMEKEHLCDFYMRGGYNAIFQSNQKFDDLYNETFKAE